MTDQRGKNYKWEPLDEAGRAPTWERVGIAVLLDIRDELQALNSLLQCQSFMSIPRYLEQIRRNTAKPRKKRKATP